TTEEISKLAGEETVHYKNESISKGRNGSNSTSDQISQRRLFTPDELSRLDLDKCIVHVKGYNIFMDQKYDVLDHKNVNKTKDGKDGELNTFIPRVYRKVIGKYDETRDQIKRWVIHEEEEDPNRKMAEAIQAGESIGNLDPKQIEDYYTSSDNIASYMQFLHTETEYLDLGEMDML
ncbi:MAG: type IV secretory system conjugative DNA transfer family protein, partial [Firmicutes bacterium]|nr:type IV secretory system conjugative DNA transfer family protein [Bacillota bacterium]